MRHTEAAMWYPVGRNDEQGAGSGSLFVASTGWLEPCPWRPMEEVARIERTLEEQPILAPMMNSRGRVFDEASKGFSRQHRTVRSRQSRACSQPCRIGRRTASPRLSPFPAE